MRMDFLPEPELEFGGGGTHIDARFGLMQYGPLDAGTPTAPAKIRVGIIGTNETVDGMRAWLERGKSKIEGRESRLRNLFPYFPGFSERSCFKSSLEFSDKWSVSIPQKTIDGLIASAGPKRLADEAASIFMEGAGDMSSKGGVTVLVCVPPQNLCDALDNAGAGTNDDYDETPEQGSITGNDRSGSGTPHFHGILKARAMRIGLPVRLARPGTYTGQKVRGSKKKAKVDPGRQDEATRAWNFYLSIYFKSGGIPWQLPRAESGPVTCYVGISFYRSPGEDAGLTSVAHLFDERGEGIVLRGSKAGLRETDGLPYLPADDARLLLRNALQEYRKVHLAALARIVVHKTSDMDDEEIDGFRAGAKEEKIKRVDLVSMRRSNTSLFRGAAYPPLRGTFLQLEEKRGLLYLGGSVNFFQTYPGSYIPRPLEFFAHMSETEPVQLAQEMLRLSKLGWSETEFAGEEPITVRAARRVGGILKCVPEAEEPRTAYRYYM